ncbi:hypothetical protein N9X97_01240 [Schleiferiaceae bacterium]|nr:hypothetical protein [Schleiferiaceae bacterium]MDA9237401.1 hypothetical protein [Schleiferiaceae bacterium]MDB2404863.1 hypothetical protein [Schleiferiaceae bacterium]MDB2502900.1 hypothetical protein [Schleiferiaceae bacterium]MDB2581425.1 hypothetical protein [Schleiferiaceae bacterium]
MTTQRKILIIGGLILLGQIIYFSDYISPFHWGQIKVSGLACTCPDETVVNGQLYLKSITPDSLKKYDLDYSEIYVSVRPSTKIDPMGVDLYIIEGQIIGKDRVHEGDPWNPKLKIDKWREVDKLKDLGIKGLFFGQLIIWLIIQAKNKNSAQQRI